MDKLHFKDFKTHTDWFNLGQLIWQEWERDTKHKRFPSGEVLKNLSKEFNVSYRVIITSLNVYLYNGFTEAF